ncbi:MAG TPA: SpoIIE family protein phosphatase [Acidimicrobiales bacterium]|nr:SpoIIE family protein phosphatase [Acidimicrobiales bacterium]
MISGSDLVRLAAALGRQQPAASDFGSTPAPDESLTHALAQAVHASRSAVMLTDAELDAPGPRVLYVNPAFEALTGWRAAEIVGGDPRVLQGPATERSVLDRLRRDLEETGSFEGRAINYRKDGSPFVMSWRIATVAGADGRRTGYVAIQDDVTRTWLAQLREHETLDALQQALLPTPAPEAEGLEVAVRYRPADDLTHLGGDWYDTVSSDDGATHLVVGDISGHGTASAARMGQFRWALHALLAAGLTPVDALSQVRRMSGETTTFATVAIATVPAGRDRVDVVTAGHPPVVHLAADGVTTLLSTDLALLGPGTPHAAVVPASYPLAPGDVLCSYTDGLVERRTRPVTEGIDMLCRHLASTPPKPVEPLAGYLSGLVAALAADQSEDDTAVVLARLA